MGLADQGITNPMPGDLNGFYGSRTTASGERAREGNEPIKRAV